MNRTILKNIIILSILLGIIFGVLAPIPYLGLVILIAVFLLSAPFVMVFLIMDGKLDLTTTQDSIIQGAVVGFVTGFVFSAVYSLIMMLLAVVFHYTTNYFLTLMISNAPVWLFIVFIAFIAVVFATTNAFSGFLTYYVINFMRDMYERNNR